MAELSIKRVENTLEVASLYWNVAHDLNRGGEISFISVKHGTGENLLGSPLQVYFDQFSDLNDRNPDLSIVQKENGLVVEFSGVLADKDGARGPIAYMRTYTYTENYIHCKYSFEVKEEMEVRAVGLIAGKFSASLNEYCFRRSHRLDKSWQRGCWARWGRFSCAGEAFELPYPPYYVALFQRGVEGLEFTLDSDLGFWEQLARESESRQKHRLVKLDDGGVELVCQVLSHSSGQPLEKGSYSFGFYLGLPKVRDRVAQTWRFVPTKSHPWPTDGQILRWAEQGVNVISIHDDYHPSGSFWHDGSYPPYDKQGMKELERVIATAHSCGIKVIPYFSLFELHPESPGYKENLKTWKRTSNARGTVYHNYTQNGEFGAQMCLQSGWRERLKANIRKVLENHKFDGVYFDWVINLYCNNAAHYPSPHCTVDGVIDVLEWTRKQLGKEGIMFLHIGGHAPNVIFENHADAVITMEEIAFNRKHYRIPALDTFPPNVPFMGGTQRLICPAILTRFEGDASERACKELIVKGLLNGALTYGRDPLILKLFEEFSRLALEGYRFYSYRENQVFVDHPRVRAACYRKGSKAIVVLGNLSGEAIKRVSCRLGEWTGECSLESYGYKLLEADAFAAGERSAGNHQK